MFVDDFDRDDIGANYTSPGRYGDLAGWSGGVIADAVRIAEPGLVRQDNTIPITPVGDAAYTGAGEFTATDQFVEITLADPLEVRAADPQQYYNNYAYYGVFLHAQPLADASGMWTAFRIWTSYYGPNNPNYTGPPYSDRVYYVDIFIVDATGTVHNSSSTYYMDYEDLGFFDGEDALPAGTKLRLEHVVDTYYAYVHNPKTGMWTLVQTLANNDVPPATDGYPGFLVSSYGIGYPDNELASAAIKQFRCGHTVDNDTFLTTNTLTGHANTARAATRGLTRNVAQAANALIR